VIKAAGKLSSKEKKSKAQAGVNLHDAFGELAELSISLPRSRIQLPGHDDSV
jgi:hypothetical protein